MAAQRVSDADRAYFHRLGEANERLAEPDPGRTLEEVFRRLEVMERTLGPLALPGLARDPELEDREAAALAPRFRRGSGRAA